MRKKAKNDWSNLLGPRPTSQGQELCQEVSDYTCHLWRILKSMHRIQCVNVRCLKFCW